MRFKISALRAAAMICTFTAVGATPALAALSLKSVPSSAYQYLTTSQFKFGHTAIAGTYITRLTAGGSYSASCASIYTPEPVTGERSLTSEVLGTYNQLYVTIPEWVPGMREMPGFDNAPRGSRISCSYNWKTSAREASYTIGIPGSSITIGGGEASDSGTVPFAMQKPGTADGDGDACIP